MFHIKIQILLTFCKTYKITIITKVYLNMLVVFHILNVFLLTSVNRWLWFFFSYFVVYWRFFSFPIFPRARCKLELLFYLRLGRAVFERTSMVRGEGSNGHCTSWCTRQERAKVFFFSNTEGFHPVKSRGNDPNPKPISKSSVAWIGDTCSGMSQHPKNYNFVQRVLNKILKSCFQPLEVISLCLFTKWYHVTFLMYDQ